MNNSIKFIFIYLFTISLCCNAADKQLANYRSIPFNRGAIDKPYSILYISDKKFAMTGDTGFEIQRGQETRFNTFKRSPGLWKLSKDDKTVAAFNEKEVFIADLDNKTNNVITISMQKECIKCVALDSAKNIIFMGYDCLLGESSGIRRYDYGSGVYHDFKCDNIAPCCSIALAPKKDVLCLLDSDYDITLRKTDDLAVVFKKIQLPTSDVYFSCIFNPNGAHLAVKGQKSIWIVDILDGYNHRTNALCEAGYQTVIKSIAFHPYGLLAALLLNRDTKTEITYWDTATKRVVGETSLSGIIGRDFCFGDDGLDLAVASDNDYTLEPVSLQVIKRYVLPSLWMKLKIINMPRDIIVHSMNAFMTYYSKKNT